MPIPELEFERFRETVKKSFIKVKEDILNQKQKLEELETQNKELTKVMSEILKELKEIKNQLRSEENQEYKQNKRVKSSSISAYDRILAILALGAISTTQLKSIVVDKEKLCSKATFYRYIKNLIKTGKVVALKDGDSSIIMLAQNQRV
ncbi:MAG: hypothetical protein PWP03_837 [Candidatus Woesearchaeota archaeon]|nr:hypothetical protein [Candidatus Woesearchaeota archaeon]MDN5328199.1 hypothetical protein [Candidatus Woesearchaeota archaeon]